MTRYNNLHYTTQMPKYYFLFLFLLSPCLLPVANCQLNYWQQQVNYTIDVSLNDKEHALDGFEKIHYINNSPDTLKFIWFHVWPNAYKHDKTAFTDQTLENGNTEFYFSDKEQRGYINRLDFKVGDATAVIEDHPQHVDIIKVILPYPLPPGENITLTTPFHVKLPFNFSRGGHNGQAYQVTQWFPKPAVYDKNGWHPMPYLDQGEYYSDFGDYKVTITVPKNYVVAATGELQNTEEKEWLKTRSAFSWKPVVIKEKNAAGQIKSVTESFPESLPETKTLTYSISNAHDFAWFADKRFIVKQDTLRLPSGKIADVFAYYTKPNDIGWQGAVQSAKRAVTHYSERVGEYPYPVVSVVEAPLGFNGGMEYPTITAIAPITDLKTLDNIIVHEVGHNWFYGILATNEREHPWMDEGMNTYYDEKYNLLRYGKQAQLLRLAFETKAVTKTDQPIETSSEKFTEVNYNLTAYYKTAEWLRYLESELGTETFNKAMQEYYKRWQFRHPQPEDFKKVIEEVSGKDLDPIFSYLSKTGTLPNQQRKGTKASFIFNFRSLAQYAKEPTKDLILYGPAIGVNAYDKFMIGAFITNAKLPPSKFQFLAMPMYGTSSKKINGIGFASYSFYSDKGLFRSVDMGAGFSSFTVDEFKGPDDKQTTYLDFYKIVPGIKLTFREKNARSNFNRYIQFKTFLIGEDGLRFFRDTVVVGIDTTISTKHRAVGTNRTLNQLQFVIENNRVLYPYRGEIKIEQGEDFVRAGFIGNYFFNYPKKGGLDVRLFAGKFFYPAGKTIFKQFSTDRYHFNMTGPNGYEDYTYSDYFIGRNKFEGVMSQQIMIRDGAFKVRTDLLADEVGKNDDWLIAANFSTTIPDAINPLTMLPVKIPVKIFLDIGTNAGAWDPGSESDRFLFDAGLQISLLKETINIYIPLIYSNVYRDYFQSTIEKKERFIKKISFSINTSVYNFRKNVRILSF